MSEPVYKGIIYDEYGIPYLSFEVDGELAKVSIEMLEERDIEQLPKEVRDECLKIIS